MNNELSLSRLMMLIRKHWIENQSFYLLGSLALFGLMAIVLVLWILASGPRYQEAALSVIYLCGLFLAGSIFAASTFNMLGDKAKGSWWLGLPASHLEKLIVSILFTTGLFFAVYSACFLILKPVAIAYITGKIVEVPAYFQFETIENNTEFREIFNAFLWGFFAVQALFLMGSAFFSKHAFIKSIILTAIILFLLFYYTYNLATWIVPRNINTGHLMEPSESQADTLEWTLKLIWAPLFWVITWFRLKEKQL